MTEKQIEQNIILKHEFFDQTQYFSYLLKTNKQIINYNNKIASSCYCL